MKNHRSQGRLARLWLAPAAIVALGACAAEPQSAYQPTESQRWYADRLGPRYQVTVPAVYCYSTLGKPDCYAAPVSGWERRLVAYRGPRPPAD